MNRLWMVVIFLMTIITPSSWAQTEGQDLLVKPNCILIPGERLCDFRLGYTRAELEKYGSPYRRGSNPGIDWPYKWSEGEVEFWSTHAFLAAVCRVDRNLPRSQQKIFFAGMARVSEYVADYARLNFRVSSAMTPEGQGLRSTAEQLVDWYGKPVAKLQNFISSEITGNLHPVGLMVATFNHFPSRIAGIGVYDLGICSGQPMGGTYVPYIGRVVEKTIRVGKAPDITASRITEETTDFKGNERVLINVELKLLHTVQREAGVLAIVETEWLSPSGTILRPEQRIKVSKGDTLVPIDVIIGTPRPSAGESTVIIRVNRVEAARVKFTSTPVPRPATSP